MKTNRLLLVVTFMSLFLFGTSLYGQQEVDPTWYNPWPTADKTTVQAPQAAPAAKPKDPRKVVARAPEHQPKTVRAKQPANQEASLKTAVNDKSAF